MQYAWIFDMDGTLTVPQHDFAALKRSLGLPPNLDILAGIDAAPAHTRADLHHRVRVWEEQHADHAVASRDAVELLEALAGRRLGVLTRNTRENALRTLAACGLEHHFDALDVLGRDCAAPKPDPAGVVALAQRWQLAPAQVVMVGDWIHDVHAGRRAGARTVWVDRIGDGRFAHEADHSTTVLGSATIAAIER